MAVKTRERVIEIPDTARINADEIVGHTNGNGHIKPVTRRPNPLETILTRAINILKARGWTTGQLEDEGGLCLVGAIQYGATRNAHTGNANSAKAIEHVYQFLPKRWKDEFEDRNSDIDPEAVVMEFNDSKAETRGQVLRLLRRALKAVR